MSTVLQLDKKTSEELYGKVVNMLESRDDFEEILDDKLINELFAREVVRYISKIHDLEENDFKRVDALVNNKTIKVSYGKMKKTIDSPSKLTYGII